VVIQYVIYGLQPDGLFWWLTVTACALLTFPVWRARWLAAKEISAGAMLKLNYNEATASAPPEAATRWRAPVTPAELTERAKYAWSWFQYHADQRMKAFNFYVVLVGIIAVGYSTALKEGMTAKKEAEAAKKAALHDRSQPPAVDPADQTKSSAGRILWSPMGTALAAVGAAISWAFLLIEIRNKELVDAGGYCLDNLEKEGLGIRIRLNSNVGSNRPFLIGALDWSAGFLPSWKSLYSHTIWLRLIYVFAGLVFVGAFAYAWWL
jgi:hypothetical protein